MPPKYECVFCGMGLCDGGEDDAWECDNCPLYHGDSTNWGFHLRCAQRNDKDRVKGRGGARCQIPSSSSDAQTWVPLENAFVYYDGGRKQVTIPEGFFLDKERKVGDKTVMALVRTRDKL